MEVLERRFIRMQHALEGYSYRKRLNRLGLFSPKQRFLSLTMEHRMIDLCPFGNRVSQ